MKPEPRDIGPLACDDCAFQVAADNSAFFCVRRSPDAQTTDGRAQWPKIERGGLPAFKGCGDGRRHKGNA
ncbi:MULTISPECIES: hypothetical protein [unclassified Bradyrhizobium]|uniref:hypothetical protein n=1 Tax=unclassified Bradyrhizobium TaxID=2631580 RepID=UPI0028EA44AC|nr:MULTISPECIES: hypothetical protein [unclassified Bradyrhizobium]